jgi:sugar phosphate permease
MVVFGVFAGMTMPSCTSASLHGVDATNAGRASGIQTTMQQVGAALGLAALVPLAAVAGNAAALRVGAGLLVLGGVVLLVMLERVTPVLRNPAAEALEVGSPSRR